MKSRAAVAWTAGKPLVIEEVEVAGPKEGEVLLQVAATGVCYTDAFTLSGQDLDRVEIDEKALRIAWARCSMNRRSARTVLIVNKVLLLIEIKEGG